MTDFPGPYSLNFIEEADEVYLAILVKKAVFDEAIELLPKWQLIQIIREGRRLPEFVPFSSPRFGFGPEIEKIEMGEQVICRRKLDRAISSATSASFYSLLWFLNDLAEDDEPFINLVMEPGSKCPGGYQIWAQLCPVLALWLKNWVEADPSRLTVFVDKMRLAYKKMSGIEKRSFDFTATLHGNGVIRFMVDGSIDCSLGAEYNSGIQNGYKLHGKNIDCSWDQITLATGIFLISTLYHQDQLS